MLRLVAFFVHRGFVIFGSISMVKVTVNVFVLLAVVPNESCPFIASLLSMPAIHCVFGYRVFISFAFINLVVCFRVI